MKEIMSYIIPVASILLSYILGRLQSQGTYRREIFRERYDKVYSPFILSLFTGLAWEIKYSSMTLEGRSVHFDILLKNVKYLDVHTAAIIPEFYVAYLNMLEFENGNERFSNAPRELDEVFSRITGSVISESLKLCRKLKLPKIGKVALANLGRSEEKEQSKAQECN